jgi:hypothetical protein
VRSTPVRLQPPSHSIPAAHPAAPVKPHSASLPAAPQQTHPTLYNIAPDVSFPGPYRPCSALSAHWFCVPDSRAAPGQRSAARLANPRIKSLFRHLRFI